MRTNAAGPNAVEFLIREYRAEDWLAICAVHDRARPDELDGSCDPRAFVPLALEQEDAASFERSRKFVACVGGRIVGFVGVDSTYLSWLYVDPAWYGRGIGRQLLRLGIRLIGPGAWTVSLAGNTRARHLYESEGFRVVRSFEGSNAGYPCSCVELALAPWQTVAARVVPGHRVASGLNGDPRFPGGTLLMQSPLFLALGFDLSAYYGGTINVSITPCRYRVVNAPVTFRNVKWHPTEPAEDFSFFDVRVIRPGGPPIAGKIYYPHPDTKPEHFQQPDVLELLLPYIDGISTGMELKLEIPDEQIIVE